MLVLLILIVSAFAFLCAGVFAYDYQETRYSLWILPYAVHPYRGYAMPFLLGGFSCFIGFAVVALASLLDVKKKQPAPPAPTF